MGKTLSSDMTEVPCTFFVCVYCLRAGTLAVKDPASDHFSLNIAGAREPTNQHNEGLNQTGFVVEFYFFLFFILILACRR